MTSPVDVRALERDLQGLDGEVRFDAVSRALYSTDASVYQIQPAGVVIPKSREDLRRVVVACRKHGCSITMRGGGTSQAGQAIGAGVVVDTSKYFNRVLEVNARERWARIEPGIVLDDLNAAMAPHKLRFAPDISSASRATVGGMLANNSAGARSVVYGKTIDHVIDLHVLLADGSISWCRPVNRPELDALSSGDTLQAACYREVHRLATDHAGEIARRYPKVVRRVGGYNLDEFADPNRPFNLAKLIVGSEGTLGIVVEARVGLVPLPAAKAVVAIQFDDLLEALGATPAILAHVPSAVEAMDAFILNHTKMNADLHRLRQTFVTGEPAALLCVEFAGDDAAVLVTRIDALEADLRRQGMSVRCHRAIEPAAQQAIWHVREA
ncbi:MAG TPA: FAD-binding oxidoreductase, partial [Vicinamibacterales bacterium]|nr:FAD-binding oxidoreductase [Vicinamibacterales bacterium]